jgi:hypothetical protein
MAASFEVRLKHYFNQEEVFLVSMGMGRFNGIRTLLVYQYKNLVQAGSRRLRCHGSGCMIVELRDDTKDSSYSAGRISYVLQQQVNYLFILPSLRPRVKEWIAEMYAFVR